MLTQGFTRISERLDIEADIRARQLAPDAALRPSTAPSNPSNSDSTIALDALRPPTGLAVPGRSPRA